jgi:predicted deacylase
VAHSFRKSAYDVKIPTLVYEGGETLRFDSLSMSRGLEVIINTLQFLNMVEGKEKYPGESILISKSRWLRAAAPGIFYWFRQAGDYIYKGDRLGAIHEPTGILSTDVISPGNGYIIAHNNACVVSLGDALFHLGVTYEKL